MQNSTGESDVSIRAFAWPTWKIIESSEHELSFESTIISRDPDQAAQSHASGLVQLMGSNKISPLYDDERRLFNGVGSVDFSTQPMASRDPCGPIASRSGTSPFEVGEINFLNKNDWTYVGPTGVVARKALRGDCGCLCDEKASTFTLRKVESVR